MEAYESLQKRKEKLECSLQHVVDQVEDRAIGGDTSIDLAEATKAMIQYDRELADIDRKLNRLEESRL